MKPLRERIIDLYAADSSLMYALMAIGVFLGIVGLGILTSL